MKWKVVPKLQIMNENINLHPPSLKATTDESVLQHYTLYPVFDNRTLNTVQSLISHGNFSFPNICATTEHLLRLNYPFSSFEFIAFFMKITQSSDLLCKCQTTIQEIIAQKEITVMA